MQTELEIHAVHEGGMRVRSSDGYFNVLMDYPAASSKPVAGFTPLAMLLASLAACSLNSVKVILDKMQQPLSGLEVRAHATRSSNHPTVLREISLEFTVKGDHIVPANVERALQLSEESICPVWNMLKASTSIRAGCHIVAAEPAAQTV